MKLNKKQRQIVDRAVKASNLAISFTPLPSRSNCEYNVCTNKLETVYTGFLSILANCKNIIILVKPYNSGIYTHSDMIYLFYHSVQNYDKIIKLIDSNKKIMSDFRYLQYRFGKVDDDRIRAVLTKHAKNFGEMKNTFVKNLMKEFRDRVLYNAYNEASSAPKDEKVVLTFVGGDFCNVTTMLSVGNQITESEIYNSLSDLIEVPTLKTKALCRYILDITIDDDKTKNKFSYPKKDLLMISFDDIEELIKLINNDSFMKNIAKVLVYFFCEGIVPEKFNPRIIHTRNID